MLKIKCFLQILSDPVVTLPVSLKFAKSALDSVSWAAAVDSTDFFRLNNSADK